LVSGSYVNTQIWNVSVSDFFSFIRNLMLNHCSLLQSSIFRSRIKTRLCLKFRPFVRSKVIKLSLVTLWQVRTCSITACLSIPSHSWFPSYRVSLVIFVSNHIYLCFPQQL
jgi:hypothetical protein